MLRATDVSFSFSAEATVLSQIDMAIESGASYAFIGSSGCGKSSLLSILAGLIPPTSGRLDGELVRDGFSGISLVLQDCGLFPWMSVLENIKLAQRLKRIGDINLLERVTSQLDLNGLESRWPAQLSGGQRQRAALARALVSQPKLLLLDEPFAALDALSRERLQDLLHDLRREFGFAMLLVSHDIAEVAKLAEEIFVLGGKPTTICKRISNPGAKDPRFSQTEEYFSRCLEIRGYINVRAASS